MLGLPSTTEVNRRFPKEAFYTHLKVDRKTRGEFVDGIERIVLANTVKPGTANVVDGKRVHEIMVFLVELKSPSLPERALEAIDSANPSPKAFVCRYGGESTTVLFRRGTRKFEGEPGMSLTAGDLDEIWDDYVSERIFGERTEGDLEARIAREEKIDKMRAEIEELDQKCRKCRQINKRNALFAELKTKQAELARFEKGE
jgi:hypothetical protein